MIKKTLGPVVKKRREALGLSQRELARRLGVKASHVGYLETGRRRPSLSLLNRIAGVLGLEREPLLLLAHPEAKALLGRPDPTQPEKPNHAWHSFVGNRNMLRRNEITSRELKVLKQVNALGKISSPRQFLFVLNSIRQAVDEE
jgi:transcriptional regulator with XRE-family HTH domain